MRIVIKALDIVPGMEQMLHKDRLPLIAHSGSQGGEGTNWYQSFLPALFCLCLLELSQPRPAPFGLRVTLAHEFAWRSPLIFINNKSEASPSHRQA